nr:hypothetical protein [Providencia sp. PROV021]
MLNVDSLYIFFEAIKLISTYVENENNIGNPRIMAWLVSILNSNKYIKNKYIINAKIEKNILRNNMVLSVDTVLLILNDFINILSIDNKVTMENKITKLCSSIILPKISGEIFLDRITVVINEEMTIRYFSPE